MTSEQWDKSYDEFYETAENATVDGWYDILVDFELDEKITALDALLGINGYDKQTIDDYCDYFYGVDFPSYYAQEMMLMLESA